MRWFALAAGVALLVLAFASAARVADTRQGLIAEVITLLAGASGISLVTYGLAARRRAPSQTEPPQARTAASPPAGRSARDLALGAGGIVLAFILVTGLAVSGGVLWASFGLLILLPMVAGSVYLFWRYFRASP